MLRHCIKRYFVVGSVFSFDTTASDKLSGKTRTEQLVDLDEVTNAETGWDRLKTMFQTDGFGNISPELNNVFYLGSLSIFVGAIYGGYMYSKAAYINFIKNNQATQFKSHLDAKKKLQDAMTMSFARGAFRWSWRLTLFTTSFVGIYTSIQIYRGKYGIIEYVVAGGASGFLYKFRQGPRAWVVGAGLGVVLGLFGGGLTNFLLHLSGMTMEEARYWQQHWRDRREQVVYAKAIEKREKEEFELLHEHSLKYKDNKELIIDNEDENKTENKS